MIFAGYGKKYLKGGRITSLDELMEQENAIFGEQLMGKGWFASFDLDYVYMELKRGGIYKAKEKEELK